MKTPDLKSSSLWLEQPRPRFAAIKADAHFDVAIIGAGITGLTAAVLLKEAGLKVGVFEKGRIGGAETGHTTAHLSFVTDTTLPELVKTFGHDEARLAWQGGAVAIDAIEILVQQHAIDCQFQRVPGILHASLDRDADESKNLAEQAELAQELGFPAQFIEQVPIFNRPGVRFADQAVFHPIKYLRGLAVAVNGDGSAIHEHSTVTDFNDDPLQLTVNSRTVRCNHLIVATHVPLMGLTNLLSATLLQTKLAGYSSYAIGARIPAGALAPAAFWDTSDPYYYLRVDRHAKHDLLVFGGQDHKTGQGNISDEPYVKLEAMLRKFVPHATVDHRWSGQVVETVDGLPYIGPVSEKQFVATGYAGNGLTFGTLAGLMARDWVSKRENPWQDLFSIDRKKLRTGAWNYLKENTSFPYHLVEGYLHGSEDRTLDSVQPGEGCIIRLDGERCAVSRDQSGELNVCSAICTHMGCVVRWNKPEATWDCPCHGSRFLPTGEVIAGPAETPLAPHDASVAAK